MANSSNILITLSLHLERYLLRKKEFVLDGQSYDLVLFRENEHGSSLRYDVFISAQLLDEKSQLTVMREILTELKGVADVETSALISGLRIIRSDSELVRVMRQRSSHYTPTDPLRCLVMEQEDGQPGNAWLYRSFLLERLRANEEVRLWCSDGADHRVWPVRLLRLDADFRLHARLLEPPIAGTRLPEWAQYSAAQTDETMANFSVPLHYVQKTLTQLDFFPRARPAAVA